MSLDIIIAKVLGDARAEAGRILEEYRLKAEGLLQAEQRLGEIQAETVRREAGNEAALEAGRIVTQARLERRIELLAARKALVDEAIGQALTKERFRDRALSKTIVSRDGETEEPFERAKLLEEIRPGLENTIAEILKI
jgi:predicted ABC-class ATPase